MTEVIVAQASDLDVLSVVIAEAFHDLPPSRWLIGDDVARREVFPHYFRMHLEHALSCGVVYTTLDRAAAALWIPVEEGKPAPPDGYARRLDAVTGLWASRFAGFDAALDGRHPAGIVHDHLAVLAVWPGLQERGVGSALLREHHARLDQARRPGYLEAACEGSWRLYRRHGYRDIGPVIGLPDGPGLFPMWREPAACPGAGN